VIEFGARRLVAPNPDDSRLRLIGVPATEVHLNFRFKDLQRLKAWQFGALTLLAQDAPKQTTQKCEVDEH
jgi:hypothetical protein